MASSDPRRLRIGRYKAKTRLAHDQVIELEKRIWDLTHFIVWVENSNFGGKQNKLPHHKTIVSSLQKVKAKLEKFKQKRERDIKEYQLIIETQYNKLAELEASNVASN